MKAKTINAILSKKFSEFAATIEDPTVRAYIENGTIITGGCIASMLLNEPVNDFDLYFITQSATAAVAQYYCDRFKPKSANGIVPALTVRIESDRVRVVIQSAGIASEGGTEKPYEYFESSPEEKAAEYVSDVMTNPGEIEDTYDDINERVQKTESDGKPDFRPVFLSTNAITLSHRVQIVLRFFGEPDQIHENYDFVHCTNYWESSSKKLTLRQPALEALLARELRYVGSKYPLCSIMRLRKFIKRGWTVNAGQILKMVMQLNALDLTNIEVLRDQLTGVDSAYFLEVITKLNDKDPEKVNAAYLVEIIDRMF